MIVVVVTVAVTITNSSCKTPGNFFTRGIIEVMTTIEGIISVAFAIP